MAPEPRLGRLFWKLLLALTTCMTLAIGGTAGYVRLTGRSPPPPAGMLM